MSGDPKAWIWSRKLQQDNNYLLVVPMSKTEWVAIVPLMFTTAIMTGPLYDDHSVSNRWCYSDHQKAIDALVVWMSENCEGEPTGWHRHPATGRRVDEFGNAYIEP